MSTSLARCRALLLAACLAAVLAGFAAGRARAETPAAWWRLNTTVAPSLLPHDGEAQLIIDATNLGDGAVNTSTTPVVVTDTLPNGAQGTVKALEVLDYQGAAGLTCTTTSTQVRCIVKHGAILPYESLYARIRVQTSVPETTVQLPNTLEIEGGETQGGGPVTPASPLEKPLRLGHDANTTQAADEQVPFGVETLEMTPENAEGQPDTQAGSHPFQFTTTLDLTHTLLDYPELARAPGFYPSSPALAKELRFTLPPGLIADTTAVPRCSYALFTTKLEDWTNPCLGDTAVGVAIAEIFPPSPLNRIFHEDIPIFNLEPAPGEPARYGFVINTVPIVLNATLTTGGEYAAEVSVQNISQAAQLLSSQVVFWGTPDDPAHDDSRGWECLTNNSDEWKENSPCTPLEDPSPVAMLTLPTTCRPLRASMSGHSWPTGEPGNQGEPLAAEGTSYESPYPLSGCESLQFDPSFTTSLETPFASTPTGIEGTLTFPQPGLTEPQGDAESSLKDTTLTLPEGLQVNPAAANGLTACTEAQAGFTGQNSETGIYEYTPAQPSCPESSKVATLHARTPLLEEELTGALYVAEPAPNGEPGKNPFNSLIALYVVLEAPNSGILVKLGAYVHLNEANGQEEAIFPATPQLPFHELTLSLLGGPRAATTSPPFCGSYQLQGAFSGWAGETADPFSEPPFQIAGGVAGSACPQGHLPFAPTFQAGPESPQAGALSPVVVRIGRPDGDQPLTGISVTEPPGFAALLSTVTPCAEPPPGQEWACGEDSLIGHARVYSGLGSEPAVVTGQAYLTSGYDGAPFGLLVRTRAKVGPFDLGWVDVRSRINVNPETAQVTVTTDAGPRGEGVPTRLKGVPVQVKALEVAVDRPGFTFNPTNCAPTAFSGTLSGSEGTSAPVSSSFTAEGCGSLPFHPSLEASTQGQASKVDGASLTVKVTSEGLGVANIHKVDLQLPKQLPSRLSTIKQACPEATFAANPASCDEGSVIGSAVIHTPVFKNPLTGPAYLVSHGGAEFPDVEFVLQGEGVKILLDGKTDIKHGITYSNFESAPDAPFTTFETVLPMGPHSALGAYVHEGNNYDVCGENLSIPTVITAQNGAIIEQDTKIGVTGCGGVLHNKTVKPTLKQQLAKALAKCRSTYKHSASKRTSCERKAHAHYAAMALAACRRMDKHAAKKRKGCEVAARRTYGARKASRR